MLFVISSFHRFNQKLIIYFISISKLTSSYYKKLNCSIIKLNYLLLLLNDIKYVYGTFFVTDSEQGFAGLC